MKKRMSKILSLSITAALLVPTMVSAADMQETADPYPHSGGGRSGNNRYHG
ncbi:hypothetical protein P9222_14795 [Paenibacillus amylolyticus]|nr:hypothetical protein [Paenibacillus amylolyticus]WFR65153.1 hypothetical protein P9222_14795 [Paenibacillus amylolyticus]